MVGMDDTKPISLWTLWENCLKECDNNRNG